MLATAFQITAFVLGFCVATPALSSADVTLQTARALLAKSHDLNNESRSTIIKANDLRQQINKIRARSRHNKDESNKAQLAKLAADLAGQLEAMQHRGATLRADSIDRRKQALQLLEQGFSEKWEPWVSNRDPLIMDDSVTQFIAHNTNIRSTHPGMLDKMAAAADRQHTDTRAMSIPVPTLTSQSAPPDLDISAFQISREEQYFAHIEVQPEKHAGTDNSVANNNVAAIPLNKMHKWRLLLSDLAGNPITGASIDIEGHMPGHVHGLPTQPRVTDEIAAGVYLVEGLKFQMKGWWVIQFNIDTGAKDAIKFNLVL